MSKTRALANNYCPALIAVLCLSLGLLALVWSTGCRRRTPQVQVAPSIPAVDAPVRATHPHHPTYRLDNGLGSPTA